MSQLDLGDAIEFYGEWPKPGVIVSDGPYGLGSRGGFDGDLRDATLLTDWYRPHVEAWTNAARPATTLWFWASELSWATLHHLLDEYGWEYRTCNVWNKGISHVAGRTNTQTLRSFPVVTEVCVHYTRPVRYDKVNGVRVSTQEWMRAEWKRTGLPFCEANEACGVKNAATRKYLTADHLWYFPPQDVFEKLVEYANEHGASEGRPYFRIHDGATYQRLRARFDCPSGVTNVWDCPPVRGAERVKVRGEPFPNQKPLSIMRLVVKVSTRPKDVVWVPFGGTCTTAVACRELDRRCFAAEINEDCWKEAVRRLGS